MEKCSVEAIRISIKNSRVDDFCKKTCPKSFLEIRWKHLRCGPFYHVWPVILTKRILYSRFFPSIFAKFFGAINLQNTLERLLVLLNFIVFLIIIVEPWNLGLNNRPTG